MSRRFKLPRRSAKLVNFNGETCLACRYVARQGNQSVPGIPVYPGITGDNDPIGLSAGFGNARRSGLQLTPRLAQHTAELTQWRPLHHRLMLMRQLGKCCPTSDSSATFERVQRRQCPSTYGLARQTVGLVYAQARDQFTGLVGKHIRQGVSCLLAVPMRKSVPTISIENVWSTARCWSRWAVRHCPLILQ